MEQPDCKLTGESKQVTEETKASCNTIFFLILGGGLIGQICFENVSTVRKVYFKKIIIKKQRNNNLQLHKFLKTAQSVI